MYSVLIRPWIFLTFIAVVGGCFVANRAEAFDTLVCVTTADELQTALTNAGTSANATIIDVSQGTYLLSSTLTYSASSGAGALTIQGGFTGSLLHGLCTSQTINPALTILDGQQSQRIMSLAGNSGSSITVKNLTFQNAVSSVPNPAALELTGFGTGSKLDLENNIFSNNTLLSQYSSVVSVLSAASSIVLNNAIVNNTLLSGTGITVSTPSGVDTLVVNNNTVSGNTCATTSAPAGHAAFLFSNDTLDAFNNIFYGNSGCTSDIEVNGESTTAIQLEYDDIGVGVYPSSGDFKTFSLANSVFVTPDFVGTGGYQLKQTSPLIDAGLNSAPGGVGTADAAGNPRIVAELSTTPRVDIGAYEVQDIIFADGFE